MAFRDIAAIATKRNVGLWLSDTTSPPLTRYRLQTGAGDWLPQSIKCSRTRFVLASKVR